MEQKHLMAVAPDMLSVVWPQIREEVATIEAPDGFLPEDVYAMCKSNGATLFLLMVGEKRVGWMVCRLQVPDLHIWQLKADAGYDVMTTFRDQLMDLARHANATKVTYGSTRKAWAKVAPDHGFKMRMIVYETGVDPAPKSVDSNQQSLPLDESNKSEVAPQ
jgi:hypothetical protein